MDVCIPSCPECGATVAVTYPDIRTVEIGCTVCRAPRITVVCDDSKDPAITEWAIGQWKKVRYEYILTKRSKREGRESMTGTDKRSIEDMAREIFWEMDKLLLSIITDDETGERFIGLDYVKYLALKKKYTEVRNA